MKVKLLKDKPYGYRVDISTEDVLPLYKRYKKWKGIPDWCPLSDDERREFESMLLKGEANETEKQQRSVYYDKRQDTDT